VGRVADNLLLNSPQEIGISTLVIYELEVGLQKSKSPAKRRKQLETLLDLVNIVPFGRREADASAAIRAQLKKLGTPIGPLDTLIAGTALANQNTLVTHNTGEFARVEGLMLADWF
jgi:tRNA(fMet)-specific endonuclease VapC